MRLLALLAFGCMSLLASLADSAEPESKTLVEKVVKAAGGEDKLLRLFRIREKLNISSDPDKKSNERVSVLEPPKFWWLGKKERVQDEK